VQIKGFKPMPTYDYRCDACDHQFEELQSFSEEPLKKCPKCGKKKLRRLFGTGAGVIFKGSGFYETDYRSESYTKAAKAEQEKSTGGTNDSKKTTAEPTAKSDKNGKTSTDNASGGAGKAKEGGKSPKSGSKAADD
jgi:putative FmdB family regulatory protein